MVIEHAFVTTLDSTESLKRASDYLSTRGFTLVPGTSAGFAVGVPGQTSAWVALEMRRGKAKAAKAKSVMQLPQVVRVEWDRGRVNVAMSIAANSAWGGGSSLVLTNETLGKPKKMKMHIQLLTAVMTGLEKLLAYNSLGQADYSEWEIAEREILAAARRRRIRNTIIILTFLAFVVAIVTLVAMNAR